VQVGDQIIQLLRGEAADKRRHISLPFEHCAANLGIGGRHAAGQNPADEDLAQTRRRGLERQIVLLVAVGAATLIEPLPVSFLGRKRRRRGLAGSQQGCGSCQSKQRTLGEKTVDANLPESLLRMNCLRSRVKDYRLSIMLREGRKASPQKGGPRRTMEKPEKLTPMVHGGQNLCFGCGMQNPHGLRLEFFLAEDLSVVCFVEVATGFEGPPGYVHGGVIATLLDEAMSKSVRARGVTAMTRSMEVDYRRPVPVAKPLRIEGRLLRSEARRHATEARILDAAGTVLASSKGVFAEVRASKMRRPASEAAPPPARKS